MRVDAVSNRASFTEAVEGTGAERCVQMRVPTPISWLRLLPWALVSKPRPVKRFVDSDRSAEPGHRFTPLVSACYTGATPPATLAREHVLSPFRCLLLAPRRPWTTIELLVSAVPRLVSGMRCTMRDPE